MAKHGNEGGRPAERAPLGELALDLLTGNKRFTDLHIESGKPAMLRLSAGQWAEALDEDGKPITVDHTMIIDFLDGVFAGEGPGAANAPPVPPRWKAKLHENGSLHPAINLSRPTADDGFVTCRVRCTVQKQMMGEAIGLVLRPLREIPKSIEALGLPIQVKAMLRSATGLRSLILISLQFGARGASQAERNAALLACRQRRDANLGEKE